MAIISYAHKDGSVRVDGGTLMQEVPGDFCRVDDNDRLAQDIQIDQITCDGRKILSRH